MRAALAAVTCGPDAQDIPIESGTPFRQALKPG